MAYQDKEQEQVTKTWAGEKAKLAQMPLDKKIGYVFTYYWMHMLIVLVIIGVIGWFVHHQMTYIDYKLYGVVINSSQVDENLEKTMPELLGICDRILVMSNGRLAGIVERGKDFGKALGMDESRLYPDRKANRLLSACQQKRLYTGS